MVHALITLAATRACNVLLLYSTDFNFGQLQLCTTAVGVEADADSVQRLLSELEGKDINELIAAGREKLQSVPSGGAVAAAAPAAAAAAGGAAPAKAEAKKEEPSEEDEVRMAYLHSLSEAATSSTAQREWLRHGTVAAPHRMVDWVCTCWIHSACVCPA